MTMRGITGIANESQPGVTVYLHPAHQLPDGMTVEQAGALFDEAFALLAKAGIYPSEIAHRGAEGELAAMNRHDIEVAARDSERQQIADQLMRWAERHQEQDRPSAAAPLAIASNMIRRGSRA